MYSEAMKELFIKVSVEIPKPLIHKEKCQPWLNSIGGNWYAKYIN